MQEKKKTHNWIVVWTENAEENEMTRPSNFSLATESTALSLSGKE